MRRTFRNPTLRMTRIRNRLAPLALAALLACGRAEDDTPAQPAQGSTSPGTGAAGLAGIREPVHLRGRLVLSGTLALVEQGAVFVLAWNPADIGRPAALPLLARKYELDDPDWSRIGDARAHYFGLSDEDRVGDVQRPLPDVLELEGRFDPDGRLQGHRGAPSATLSARNGDGDLQILLPSQTATAQPGSPRKKGG